MTTPQFNDPGYEVDLPIYMQVANIIQHHTVGLVRLEGARKLEKGYLHIGAGSLIQYRGMKGILTAKHSTDCLRDGDSLGLPLSQNSTIFRIDFPKRRVIVMDTQVDEEYGPDLSFIPLSPIEASSINIELSFIDMDRLISENSQITKFDVSDAWAICGTPGEKTKLIINDPYYKNLLQFQNYCLFIDPPLYIKKENGFDYWECQIDYSKLNTLPVSFGGMSGGGLWLVKEVSESKFSYSLIGDIFYQTANNNGFRVIRCHGHESINKLLKTIPI